jgi:NADPH:quinone reductase-like Zn-dependent oxidoreductase
MAAAGKGTLQILGLIAASLVYSKAARSFWPATWRERLLETGAAVTRFHVGDKITSHLYSKWLDGPIGLNSGDTLYGGQLPGGLAEYMLLNELSAVRAPSYLSDEEALTLPIAGLTAWFALTNASGLTDGLTAFISD